MARNAQEPTEVVRPDGRGRAFLHPAFGQIGVSRVSSNGAVLYGSDFKHQHFMVLRVSESELIRDLSYDRHHERVQLIEVALTEAQWAGLVASPNQGAGTPCTIYRVAGETRPDITYRQQADVFKEEAASRLAEMDARVAATIKNVEDQAAGLSKVKRDALLADLLQLRRDLHDRLPFIANSFAEHMEHTVEAAKTEVHAWTAATIQQAGLAALSASQPMRLQAGTAADETREGSGREVSLLVFMCNGCEARRTAAEMNRASEALGDEHVGCKRSPPGVWTVAE